MLVVEVVPECGFLLLGCFIGEKSSDRYNLGTIITNRYAVVPKISLGLGKERLYAPLAIVTLGAWHFPCVTSRSGFQMSYAVLKFKDFFDKVFLVDRGSREIIIGGYGG